MPQTILASIMSLQHQANAHLNLDNSSLNKCPKLWGPNHLEKRYHAKGYSLSGLVQYCIHELNSSARTIEMASSCHQYLFSSALLQRFSAVQYHKQKNKNTKMHKCINAKMLVYLLLPLQNPPI